MKHLKVSVAGMFAPCRRSGLILRGQVQNVLRRCLHCRQVIACTNHKPNAAKKEKKLIIVYLSKRRQIDVKTGENHRIRCRQPTFQILSPCKADPASDN